MTTLQAAVMVALAALATQITRWTPFLLFLRKTPKFILYLGTVLPPAIWGMLVVYCFRNGTLTGAGSGVPEVLAAAATVLLQVWKRNMALTIAGGTLCYMLLVQLVFPH